MAAHNFGDVAEHLRRCTVHVHVGGGGVQGSGSGVVWTPEGTIVTNAHVARDSHATIELWDGRQLSAELTARDRRKDLASLQVHADDLTAAVAGDSSALRPGELVIAIGNPLGFTGALSTGCVHALGPLRGLGTQNWIQADVRLLPGNSGGPLADARGRVVGINTMIAGGLALAIPSNTVAEFLRRGHSDVSLGVTVQPVPVDTASGRLFGLLVLHVAAGSAAADASLITGDLLIGAGGRRFRSADDLADAIEGTAGSVLQLEFLRGDRRSARHVAVRLGGVRAEAA
jgi:serine protease Do